MVLEETEIYESGAVVDAVKQFIRGNVVRNSDDFAPSVPEFLRAVKETNFRWDGMRRRGLDEISQRAKAVALDFSNRSFAEDVKPIGEAKQITDKTKDD